MAAPCLTLVLSRDEGGNYRISADARDASGASTIATALLVLDFAGLRAAELQHERYGRQLADGLLGATSIASLYSSLRTASRRASTALEIRLRISAELDELHALRWERLWTDEDGPLCGSEHMSFARIVEDSSPLGVLDPRPRNGMRALVVVASPANSGKYEGLNPIDADVWTRRIVLSLGGIRATHLSTPGQATLARLCERLSEGYDILYLVCHGRVTRAGHRIWLEDDVGNADVIAAEVLVERIKAVARLPRFVVLVSCHSAGNGEAATAANSLGRALARAGVPAVLAMQDLLSERTATALMPSLFRAMTRHGQIARALAMARAGVLCCPQSDWWVPTLFLNDEYDGIWPAVTREDERADRELVAALQRHFDHACDTWLKQRYEPSLHQAGQIEDDLRIRLRGPGSVASLKRRAAHLAEVTGRAQVALARLPRHVSFRKLQDGEPLREQAGEWMDGVHSRQTAVLDALTTQAAFPLALPAGDEAPVPPEFETLLKHLAEGSPREHTTGRIEKALKAMLDTTEERTHLLEELRAYGRTVLYDAGPGAGKTHALAHLVRECLSVGIPALLLRAREIDPRRFWYQILAAAVEGPIPGDGLLASMDRAAARRSEPCRILVAVDGLDESIHRASWSERLREIAAMAETWPEVVFAASTRTSLANSLADIGAVARVQIDGESDAPLDRVFAAHCAVSEIHCPPTLRWALRSSLAIRLFADVFRRAEVPSQPVELSLTALMTRKLEHVEAVARERDDTGWSSTLRPVRGVLRAVTRATIEAGGPIPARQAMVVSAADDAILQRLSSVQIGKILECCRDEGLLMESRGAPDDPFSDDVEQWEPAYESLTDFVLAREIVNDIDLRDPQPDVPPLIAERPETQDLVVAMLTARGERFFDSNLWAGSLGTERREALQLRALLAATRAHAATFTPWVQALFVRDMPGCRRVLDCLVVPGARLDHPFDPRFVHRVLAALPVVERDLIWSGPRILAGPDGEVWAGHGADAFRSLELDDAEDWHMAPLLSAWRLTSVENEVRGEVRDALARWGASHPEGLLQLLQATSTTSDDQMRGDLLQLTFQAANAVRPDERWLPLCAWAVPTFMSLDAPGFTDDVVVRHAVHSLVERMLACGLAVEASLVDQVRDRRVVEDRLAVLDREVAASGELTHGVGPIKDDLAWYVVPNAYRDFFARTPSTRQPPPEKAPSDERDGLDAATVAYIEKLLTADDAELTEEERDDRQQIDAALHPAEPGMSEQASALLAQHARGLGLPTMSPVQFAFAFVTADVLRQGWDRARFRGRPNGGAPGELLGPDVAILRMYRPATHGERSRVSTFAEKYVWSACDRLVGYLADRLPLVLSGDLIPPPVRLGLARPGSTVSARIGRGEHVPLAPFAAAAAGSTLSAELQVERAREWITTAPVLYPRVYHRFGADAPDWLRGGEWVVLRASAVVREPDSEADTHVSMAGFVFSAAHRTVMETVGELPGRHDLHAEISSAGTYQDPQEATWSPWVRERHGTEYHEVDAGGVRTAVALRATCCEFYSHDYRGEESQQLMPAEWLRRALDVADHRAGRFLGVDGETLAYHASSYGRDGKYDEEHATVLLVRRNRLEQVLASEGLEIGWNVRMSREPALHLRAPAYPHLRREFDAFVLRDPTGEARMIRDVESVVEAPPRMDG